MQDSFCITTAKKYYLHSFDRFTYFLDDAYLDYVDSEKYLGVHITKKR